MDGYDAAREDDRVQETRVALWTAAVAAGVTTAAVRAAAFGLVTIVGLLFVVPSCLAQTPPVSVSPNVTGTPAELHLSAGFEQGYVLRGSSGEAFMVIDLHAAQAPTLAARPAMSVALVIDRSGSMAGPKIARAIEAASSFIHSLHDGDAVAIYQYDDVVEELAPPTAINAATRPALVARLAGLYPRGSTNLHGGLLAGIQSLSRPGAERPLRRVVLISDGLANVGPSSAAAIGQVAAGAASRGVSVTAIGVGLDYDEAVLGAVAVRSGGRFYHLQEPSQMAAILESELNALTATVARNVVIDLVPAPGVVFLGATGADVQQQLGGHIQLRVGEVLGGTHRPVVVSLRVPTNGLATHAAGTVALNYLSAESGTARRQETPLRYQLTSSQAQVNGSVDGRFAVAVERHRAADANQRAAALLEQGQNDQAALLLDQQAQHMRRRARALPQAQRAQMEQEATRVARSRESARRARSRPARRAASLRMSDDALDGLGF